MIKNYFKIAVRNLLKYKSYAIINLLGLSIGMASVILIMLYVNFETSFDIYNKNADRIYRVTREWFNSDGSTSIYFGFVAPPIAPLFKNDFEQVEQAVRIAQAGIANLKYQDKIYQAEMLSADPEVFDVFTFPFIQGDPASALQIPNGLVLTQSTAQKIFGNKNPLHQILILPVTKDIQIDLIVTGIINDPPVNSHFHFEALNSMVGLRQFYGEEEFSNWGSNNYATYILLKEGANVENINRAIPQFLIKHLGDNANEWNTLHLQPLKNIHLHSHLDAEFEPNGNIIYVYILSIIAVIILMLACVNFINLATARSTTRVKEIGIKKVVGANRRQIIVQFLGETFILSIMSLLIAIGILVILRPVIQNFFGFTILENNVTGLILPVISLSVIVGLFAGSYPAFYMAQFPPLLILRAFQQSRTLKSSLRKALVISQFSISIILMICLGVVFEQLNYCKNKDLGFDKEQLLNLPANREMIDNYEAFKARLMQNPNIAGVTASKRVPSAGLADNSEATVYFDKKEMTLGFRLANVRVNYDFLQVYGIKLAAGRDFDQTYATDNGYAFILNETAVQKIGWKSPSEALDQPMTYGGLRGQIIGVIKDFHYESFHKSIAPFMLFIAPDDFNTITIKLAPQTHNTFQETAAFLKSIWQEYLPNDTFHYTFLNDRYNRLYNTEQKQGNLLTLFSLLAIFISCLGLLGLVSFFTQRKTKEIGIRKALGASIPGIILYLTSSYIKWIVMANIIAFPVAWYAMNKWLQNFAYHVNMKMWVYLVAAATVLLIAMLSVSWQVIRAATANPVEALRYE
ncbi:MAG TPA: ABC transporter permease [bacterium]|nr:ABC transporter permease [bacterium]HPN45873.1 ABC transporter permease [bacterium]